MYSYILIPPELSLVLRHQEVQICTPVNTCTTLRSNRCLNPGSIFYPDEGEVRHDTLDMEQILDVDDVSTAVCYI